MSDLSDGPDHAGALEGKGNVNQTSPSNGAHSPSQERRTGQGSPSGLGSEKKKRKVNHGAYKTSSVCAPEVKLTIGGLNSMCILSALGEHSKINHRAGKPIVQS